MKEKDFLELKKELLMIYTMSLGKQEVVIRATLDKASLTTEQELELLNFLTQTITTLKICKNQREELENKIEIAGDENG